MLTPLVAPGSGAAPREAAEKGDPSVTEVAEPIVEKSKLYTTFYKKHLDYKGFSILSSAKVSDEALLEARYLLDQLRRDREDILKALIKRGCRFMVLAPTEMTTGVPEQRRLKGDPKGSPRGPVLPAPETSLRATWSR
jgi:alpha-glucosidase